MSNSSNKDKQKNQNFKEFIQIDSFFNDFFDDNLSQPKPRKKKTGTQI